MQWRCQYRLADCLAVAAGEEIITANTKFISRLPGLLLCYNTCLSTEPELRATLNQKTTLINLLTAGLLTTAGL